MVPYFIIIHNDFLSGCLGAVARSGNLMAEIKADVAYAGVELSGDNAAAVTDFAVRLFQHSAEDGRTP